MGDTVQCCVEFDINGLLGAARWNETKMNECDMSQAIDDTRSLTEKVPKHK